MNNSSGIKVSVVVPVYNASRYLVPCLESILGQSLHEIEVFCVDDGSTDDSLEILQRFSAKDSRVKVLRQKNKGAGAARNLALRSAQGAYLSILDADDVFDKHMLESAYARAVGADADIAIFQHEKLDDRTGDHVVVPQFADASKFPDLKVFCADDFAACGKSWFNSLQGWTWDKLFKREFIAENRLAFQTTKIYNDMFFTYAAVASARRIVYLPKILMSQRINHKGRLSGKIQNAWPCVIEALGGLKDYLVQQDLYEKWQTYFSNYCLRMLLYTYERVEGEEKLKAECAFQCYALKRLNIDLDDGDHLTIRVDVEKAKRYWNPNRLSTGCATVGSRPARQSIGTIDLLGYLEPLLSHECFDSVKAGYADRFLRMTENRRPTVSVVVPVYNVESTLAAALNSLVRQTQRNIEVVCVNDGSKDSSAQILEQYASKYSNVHVLTFARNMGLMMAMKIGSFYAVGQYVTVLESDDELTLDACELMYEHARKSGADLIQGKTQVLNPNDLPQSRLQVAVKLLEPYPHAIEGQDIVVKSFVEHVFPMNVCGKLYERELIQDAFLHLRDVHTFMASDSMTFFVAAALARRYESIPQFVYRYNYGLGITGRTKLTFGDFEKQCAQVDILPPLREFSQGWPYIEKAYRALQKRMYNEAFGRIFEYLDEVEDRRRGLELLNRKIGNEELVKFLAEKFFNNQGELVDIVERLGLLPQTVKTPIRRIGIYYYHMTPGGVQRVIAHLVGKLQAMGYGVHVILDNVVGGAGFELPFGVGVSYLPPAASCTSGNIVARLERLQEIVRDEHIDMMYYHAYSSNVLLWDMLLCKKALGIPFVVHQHTCAGFRLAWNRTSPAFALHTKLMALADGVITLSRVDELFFRATGARALYIPNPICTEPDEGVGGLEPEDRDSQTILWCARISPEKQVFDAVRIFMQVLKRKPSARLVIVGGGDKKTCDELARFIDRNGLSESVALVGETAEPYKYFAEASVFLQTSGIEGFSLTVAEALQFHLPVVAYELPYLEIMQDNPGVIQVRQNSFPDAATAICKLLDDPRGTRVRVEKGLQRIKQLAGFDYDAAWGRVMGMVRGEVRDAEPGQANVSLDEVGALLAMLAQCHSFGFRLAALAGARGIPSSPLSGTALAADQKTLRHLQSAEREVVSLKASESYRVGMFLTWPLRKLKKFYLKKRHRGR